VLERCDQALSIAASVRKEKDNASDHYIEKAIRELEYYESKYDLS